MFGNDNFTKILLHFESTFTDNCAGASPHTFTGTGTVSVSSAQAKFGLQSLNTGAAAGQISAPDSADFTLSADWTMDLWFYRSGGDGTLRIMCGQGDATAANNAAYLQLTSGNVCALTVSNGTTSTNVTGTTTFTTTGWNHIAGVRTGNNLMLFVNGTQEGGTVGFASSIPNSTANFGVGTLGAGNFSWNGFIDEFRLSVGLARWTANFTAPNEPYDVPVCSKPVFEGVPDQLEIVSY